MWNHLIVNFCVQSLVLEPGIKLSQGIGFRIVRGGKGPWAPQRPASPAQMAAGHVLETRAP